MKITPQKFDYSFVISVVQTPMSKKSAKNFFEELLLPI